uniref:Uncharacterized protein n=1 Tax=Arundo donax TaxID=35708 RepID=A0A0A9BXX6_ARUDO
MSQEEYQRTFNLLDVNVCNDRYGDICLQLQKWQYGHPNF